MVTARSVLIVDDDTVLSDLYRVKFEGAGYKVSVAHNGQDGIGILSSGIKPDVILLDVMMPVMTGFEFLQEAQHKGIELPLVIMLTNQQEEVDKMRSFAYGADHFIQKAIVTPKDVLAKVEDMLQKSTGSKAAL